MAGIREGFELWVTVMVMFALAHDVTLMLFAYAFMLMFYAHAFKLMLSY